MNNIDLILKGVTTGWISGNYWENGGKYNELIVIVAVNSCTIVNRQGAEWKFPELPLLEVSIEPFRHLPINDKHALITAGSSVELHITGTSPECLKAEVVKVVEHKARKLQEFAEAVYLKP